MNGDRRLWQAVILLYFRDIIFDRKMVFETCTGARYEFHKRELDRHIEVALGFHFKWMCESAGLIYKDALNLVFEMIFNGKEIDLPVRF